MDGGPESTWERFQSARNARAALSKRLSSEAHADRVIQAAVHGLQVCARTLEHVQWLKRACRLLDRVDAPSSGAGDTSKFQGFVPAGLQIGEVYQLAMAARVQAFRLSKALRRERLRPWRLAGTFALQEASELGLDLGPTEMALLGVAARVDKAIMDTDKDGRPREQEEFQRALRRRVDTWRKRLNELSRTTRATARR